MTRKFHMFTVLLVLLGVWVPTAWAAGQPYQWTAAQVATAVNGKCAKSGVGFRCMVAGKPLYVKVRTWGAGKTCTSRVSLAKVSTACLAQPIESEDPRMKIRRALGDRLDYGSAYDLLKSNTCTGGRGVYQCSFVTFGRGDGTATVVYSTAANATVTFTTITCAADNQARFPEAKCA